MNPRVFVLIFVRKRNRAVAANVGDFQYSKAICYRFPSAQFFTTWRFSVNSERSTIGAKQCASHLIRATFLLKSSIDWLIDGSIDRRMDGWMDWLIDVFDQWTFLPIEHWSIDWLIGLSLADSNYTGEHHGMSLRAQWNFFFNERVNKFRQLLLLFSRNFARKMNWFFSFDGFSVLKEKDRDSIRHGESLFLRFRQRSSLSRGTLFHGFAHVYAGSKVRNRIYPMRVP